MHWYLFNSFPTVFWQQLVNILSFSFEQLIGKDKVEGMVSNEEGEQCEDEVFEEVTSMTVSY